MGSHFASPARISLILMLLISAALLYMNLTQPLNVGAQEVPTPEVTALPTEGTAVAVAQDSVLNATVKIYLPLVSSGKPVAATPTTKPTTPTTKPTTPTTKPVTTTPVTPTTEPVTNDGAFFLAKDIETNSANIVVDANGGMHVAAAAYVPFGNPSPVFYGYCSAKPVSSCGTLAGWQVVRFGSKVDEVILKLNAAGKPRMLMLTNDNQYHYAACDNACTNAASWSAANVATSNDLNTDQFDKPQHYFALDAQGRPGFLFTNTFNPDVGVYYATCAANCTNANSWTKTKISYDSPSAQEIYADAVVGFTPQGQPRIFANVFPDNDSGDTDGLFYIGCDTNCTDGANWTRTNILERGQGPDASWDMEIDSTGRPRVAFYQEETPDGKGNKLNYAWCNANCLTASNWQHEIIGLDAGIGYHPDLALDGQGRPRIAFNVSTDGGFGYMWCNLNCQSNQAQWTYDIYDPMSDLEADFNIPTPGNCTSSGWLSGYRMSLSLDAQGNPRIAYDAENIGTCFTSSGIRMEKLWIGVRTVFFPQPN